MKIIIASPIRQKSSILAAFLESVASLDCLGLDIVYWFADDNTDVSSSNLLSEFAVLHPCTRIYDAKNENPAYYECGEFTHTWSAEAINRVARIKNVLIRSALDEGFDYLFFVDSDLLLPKGLIRHLLSRHVDIVSEVFWTIHEPGMPPAPQVWIQDYYSFYRKRWYKDYSESEINEARNSFFYCLKQPGIYKVGGLGACTLISERVFRAGVDFSIIDNVSFWGEDRHFCIRAQCAGFSLFADTCLPPLHCYREQYLELADDFYANGFRLEMLDYKMPSLPSTRVPFFRRITSAVSRLLGGALSSYRNNNAAIAVSSAPSPSSGIAVAVSSSLPPFSYGPEERLSYVSTNIMLSRGRLICAGNRQNEWKRLKKIPYRWIVFLSSFSEAADVALRFFVNQNTSFSEEYVRLFDSKGDLLLIGIINKDLRRVSFNAQDQSEAEPNELRLYSRIRISIDNQGVVLGTD